MVCRSVGRWGGGLAVLLVLASISGAAVAEQGTEELRWISVQGVASEDPGQVIFATPFIADVGALVVAIFDESARIPIPAGAVAASFGFSAVGEDGVSLIGSGEAYRLERLELVRLHVPGYADVTTRAFVIEEDPFFDFGPFLQLAEMQQTLMVSCPCGRWIATENVPEVTPMEVKVSISTLGSQAIQPIVGYLSCGDTVTLTSPNAVATFSSSLGCELPGCSEDYCYVILDPYGNLVRSGERNPSLSYGEMSSGTYTVILMGQCGGSCCPPCEFYIERCACSSWTSTTVIGGRWCEGHTDTHECGGSAYDHYPPYTPEDELCFEAEFITDPVTPACPVTYGWTVTHESGEVIEDVSGSSACVFTLNPGGNDSLLHGNYTVELRAEIDGTPCPSCTFGFSVQFGTGGGSKE